MTNKQHLITPPPELVRKWLGAYFGTTLTGEVSAVELALATQAARWGADQELEECCQYISNEGEWFAVPGHRLAELRAARRPKPPSEADLALADLDALVDDLSNHGMGFKATNLRRALERLKELEGQGNG